MGDTHGDTLTLGHRTGDRAIWHLDQSHEVEAHAALFQFLSEVALPPADSMEQLRSVSKEEHR